jgi:DNA repair protein SbcC/Rad50
MKILAIRGANLTSLAGEFALNLNAAPLAGAGLFTISGPTGAGKSTLLDSLCLALFDAVPRQEVQSKVLAENILRHGCSYAYAETEFRGNDGEIYCARWEVRRARGRLDGSLQMPVMRLTRQRDQVCFGDKKTEVLAQIEQRLGLSFTQFRRAVLLAQGDFAAFLKAKANERAELLERMTGIEIYSKLSIAAHERAKLERQQSALLEARYQQWQPLSDEQRLALENERLKAHLYEQQCSTELRQAQQVLAWHQHYAELSAQVAAARTELEHCDHAWHAAATIRSDLAEYEQAQPLLTHLNAHQAALHEQQQAATVLAQAQQQATTAATTAHAAASAQQQADADLVQAETLWHNTQAELKQARTLDVRLDNAVHQQTQTHNALIIANKAVNSAAHILQKQRQELHRHEQTEATTRAAQSSVGAALAQQWPRWHSEFQRYHDSATEAQAAAIRAQQAHTELCAITEKIAKAHVTLDKINLELSAVTHELHNTPEYDWDALEQRRQELEQQREHWHTRAHVAQEQKRLRTLQTKLQAQEVEIQQHLAHSRNAEAQAQAHWELLQNKLQAAQAARDIQLLTHLRAHLVADQPCPLCGSRHHPGIEHSVTQENEDSDTLQTQAQAMLRQSSEQRAAQQHWQAQLTQLRAELADCTAALRREEQPAQSEDIEAQQHQLKQAWAHLEQERRQAHTRQQHTQALRQRLDELQQQWRTAHHDLNTLTQEQHSIHTRETHAHNENAKARQTLDEIETRLAEVGTLLPQWPQTLRRDSAAVQRQCETLVAQWQVSEQELRTLAPIIQSLRMDIQRNEVEHAQKIQHLAQINTQWEQCVAETTHLQQQRRLLLAGESADSVEARLNQNVTTTRSTLAHWREHSEHARHALTVAETALTHAQTRTHTADAHFNATDSALTHALQCAGVTRAQVEHAQTRPPEWAKQQRHTLHMLEQQRAAAQIRVTERHQRWHEHEAMRPPHSATDKDSAQAHVDTVERQWQAAGSALHQVLAQLQQDDACHIQAQEARTQWQAQMQQAEVWAQLDVLIGSNNGDKFRRFAQGLTLDNLLAYTNRHLDELARRYQIARVPGSDLELHVVDREMGDETRGIHSLSGGETFLVSLALALGLASLSAQRSSIESLFIDEGFGSLDPDTLDIAVAGLDALQARGCQVGIISHVPGLAERIGVQVRVEKQGGGGSKVII